MDEHALKPERITKPIQLLGAWLAGLFTIDSCFLFAAGRLPEGAWEAGALTVAAIVNVPLFLLAVFLLQTRFRPELQEDSYYSTYLSRKTNEPITLSRENVQIAQLRQRIIELEGKVVAPAIEQDVVLTTTALSDLHIGVNKHLADRAHIGAKLSEMGVLGFSAFGSDVLPEGRVLAISESLSKDRVAGILKIAKELGFTGYTFFDRQAEEAEEDILFGSYGNASYQIAGVEA